MQTNIDQAITAHQEGKLEEAEKLYQEILKTQPKHYAIHCNLGSLLYVQGRFHKAEVSLRKAIELKPEFDQAHNNLGNTLKDLDRLNEAEASYRKAIELKPDFAQAHNNLGILLIKLHRFDEAEASYRKAIELNPNHSKAHNNLGVILFNFDRLDEAEACYRKAIELKPNFADAYCNLGILLFDHSKLEVDQILNKSSKNFNRLNEAEVCYRKAIELKPDFCQVYYNLGNALKNLGRLKESETSFRKAIELKADFKEAHINLRLLLKEKNLLLKISQTKKILENKRINNVNSGIRLPSDPFITHRDVEVELLDDLYKINFKEFDKTAEVDSRYGIGKCSDFHLFESHFPTKKKLIEDLTSIMEQTLKSEIFILDSFLNIYSAGSGVRPHAHISFFDQTHGLVKQKYSLAYYLSVGDQNCSRPGNLKLHDPDEELSLSNGTLVIIPSTRKHSSDYGGKLDRVMIGLNFYSLF